MKIVDLLFLLLLEDVGSEPRAVELSLCFGSRLPQELLVTALSYLLYFLFLPGPFLFLPSLKQTSLEFTA